ncbi:hypothetical protein HJ590_02780 [Naumannella sp. ID2617S]|nr:hypothetical protein [Naumannella sp. ID2617S]
MDTTDRWDWVDARPFRMHARRLIAETGLRPRELALFAGVPPRLLARLVAGDGVRKLTRVYARRLIAIELRAVPEALHLPVPARRAATLCQRLRTAGFGTGQLAELLGGDRLLVQTLLTGETGEVSLRVELAVAAAAYAQGISFRLAEPVAA